MGIGRRPTKLGWIRLPDVADNNGTAVVILGDEREATTLRGRDWLLENPSRTPLVKRHAPAIGVWTDLTATGH